MIVESFPVAPLQCNCTLIGDEQSGECIVIDPGADAERVFARANELNLRVRQILLTHGHIDHVFHVATLRQLTNAPVLMHEADVALIEMMATQSAWLAMDAPETVHPDVLLEDGQIVGLPALPAQVLHTPGHSKGSVCFYFDSIKLLVAGDTLFAGSVGRTDLPGGNAAELIHSIRTHLLVLPDEVRVITGHGPATTIGEEKRYNPFLAA